MINSKFRDFEISRKDGRNFGISRFRDFEGYENEDENEGENEDGTQISQISQIYRKDEDENEDEK